MLKENTLVMHRQNSRRFMNVPLALTKRRVGASAAKSLRFSPQFLTHQTSHNKHAFKQSS